MKVTVKTEVNETKFNRVKAVKKPSNLNTSVSGSEDFINKRQTRSVSNDNIKRVVRLKEDPVAYFDE
jgi:hypothetical protein